MDIKQAGKFYSIEETSFSAIRHTKDSYTNCVGLGDLGLHKIWRDIRFYKAVPQILED